MLLISVIQKGFRAPRDGVGGLRVHKGQVGKTSCKMSDCAHTFVVLVSDINDFRVQDGSGASGLC